MNIRLAATVMVALAVMILTTACLGPGVGVEANCVTLQTCGKTVVGALSEMAGAVFQGLRRGEFARA